MEELTEGNMVIFENERQAKPPCTQCIVFCPLKDKPDNRPTCTTRHVHVCFSQLQQLLAFIEQWLLCSRQSHSEIDSHYKTLTSIIGCGINIRTYLCLAFTFNTCATSYRGQGLQFANKCVFARNIVPYICTIVPTHSIRWWKIYSEEVRDKMLPPDCSRPNWFSYICTVFNTITRNKLWHLFPNGMLWSNVFDRHKRKSPEEIQS